MKTVGYLVMVVGLVLLGASAPRAYGQDGNMLLRMCTVAIWGERQGQTAYGNAQDGYDTGYCHGIINGLTMGSLSYFTLRAEALGFCRPPGFLPMGQATRVVQAYLQQHPERLHLPQTDLIIEAFRAAYPCPSPDATTRPKKQGR